MAVAHTKLRGPSPAGLQLNWKPLSRDLNPLLSDPGVNDEPLYAAAAGYADLGKLEISAARTMQSLLPKSPTGKPPRVGMDSVPE